MIIIAAIFATFFALVILLTNPYLAVHFVIAVKPLIDATWDSSLLGVSLLDVIGVAVPSLMLFYILRSKHFNIGSIPLAKIGVIFVSWNLFVSAGMFLMHGDVFSAADYAFRSLNFFAGILIIPFVVRDPHSFRKLLIFMLIAGLFPMLMGIYQALSGVMWEVRIGAYGLERNVGLYHDAFSFRAYGFQTLTAIILMLCYFCPRNLLQKRALVVYAILCCIVLFNVYSKAAIVVGLCWLIIWSILHKNKTGVVLAMMIGMGILLWEDTQVFQQLETLFGKEIRVYQGQLDDRYILQGRPVIWERYWREWQEFDVITQMFGYWKTIGAHNDLLLLLYTAGVFGLLIYVLFLLQAGVLLFKRINKQKTPLTIMGVMVFTMWVVDVTGLTPSLYPAYCWYVWGFVVLAIRGVPGLETATVERARDSAANLRIIGSR